MNDLADLPEYSLSLPTWHADGKGGFIGCKRWKRRTLEGWMIGEARIEDGEIKVTWSHPIDCREPAGCADARDAEGRAPHGHGRPQGDRHD